MQTVAYTACQQMQEQVALLMQDSGEWRSVADDEERERVFNRVGRATPELQKDGGEIVEGSWRRQSRSCRPQAE